MEEEKKVIDEKELDEKQLDKVSGGIAHEGSNTVVGGGLLPPFFCVT